MINRLLPSNRELDEIVKRRKECRDEFHETTKKVNGYLRSKVKAAQKCAREQDALTSDSTD